MSDQDDKKWWQKEYDPIGALVERVQRKAKKTKVPVPTGKRPTHPPSKAAGLDDKSMPDFKELEKKGMLGKFFRHWKNPAFLKQMKAVAARMQADGVNIKDQKAVKAWIEKHQSEIESGEVTAGPAAKQQTFVRTEAAVGRNAPCPCGSGKKYKKCCGKA